MLHYFVLLSKKYLMNRNVRVRFAPSPTGPLHPGGVRTALFNYLFAKQNGGEFLLRIEDTDQGRFVPGAEEFIINSLAWCGIQFDEGVHLGGPFGPYRQSERKEMYRSFAMQLIESGHAYYAFDTPEALDEMRDKLKAAQVASPQYNAITRVNMRNSLTLSADEVTRLLSADEPYVIRFKMPRNEEIRVNDIIRGWVVVNSSQLDDKVLFKSDGMPTYHLANVVDDYLMKISHVIRGEEWLPSTPLHVMLYRAFGWENQMPAFAHLPLLLKPDGDGKLSKRDGDRLGLPFYAIAWTNPETNEVTNGYREAGYMPQAYINFLALLGWNPGDNTEIFSLNDLVEKFSLGRVNKHGARYDFNKLNWFNQQYLRSVSNSEIAKQLMPMLETKGHEFNNIYVEDVVALVKDRMVLVRDFWHVASYFFEAPQSFDQEVAQKRWKSPAPQFIEALADAFERMKSFSASDIEFVFKETAEKNGLKQGAVIQTFRLALSGVGVGPAIFDMAELLGAEEVVGRLRYALQEIPKML